MSVSLPKEYSKNPNNDLIPIEVTSIEVVKNIYEINGDLENLYIKRNEYIKIIKSIELPSLRTATQKDFGGSWIRW